jgi:hypothetical protein
MRLFRCTCEGRPVLYFENVQCGRCGRLTGFCPETLELKPFNPVDTGNSAVVNAGAEPAAAGSKTPPPAVWEDDSGKRYVQCTNWVRHQVCNWMLPLACDDSAAAQQVYEEGLCPACRLNEVVPDLSVPENQPLWYELETAKRRCLFTLLELDLALHSSDNTKDALVAPLSFRFMSDKDAGSHFQCALEGEEPVFTGHMDGVITINLAEADDIARTQTRVAMQERYRTLLGHFRHESGHYYWDVLKVIDPGFVASFRAVFGDETASYQDALDRHYESGPPADWQVNFVSAYASMHPWEDWAETWAHYLHIIDTLETLQNFNRSSDILSDSVNAVKLPFAVGTRGDKGKTEFAEIMELWIDASIMLNSLNRSMGLPDPYPFVLHTPIQDKLRFVHEAISLQIQKVSLAENFPRQC